MTNRNLVRIKQEEDESNKKPILEYNDKTYKSYVSQGFGSPDLLDYQEKHFLSQVDIETGGPITRTVTKIVRLRAPDYSTIRKERKEYLIYYENWYGKDWQTRKLPPVTDHIEGVYYEQETEPVIERNKK